MQGKEKPTQQYYPGSVLLSDHIKSFVNKELLIVDDTFDERQLQRAKYNVRLGKAYYKAGEYGNLDDDAPLLKIAPYELVFVESYEIFKLPDNVVAKYDLRISGCLAGLGLQTGLQLDPTYYGRFFSPLFNFSDTPITIKYKDQLASVDFIYTTPPTSQTTPFSSARQRKFSLSQALPDVPRGSGLGKLWRDIKEAQDSIKVTEKGINTRLNDSEIRMEEGRREMRNVNRVFLMLVGIILTTIAAILVPQAIGQVMLPPVDLRVVGMIVGAFLLVAVALVWAIAWASTRGSRTSAGKQSRRGS